MSRSKKKIEESFYKISTSLPKYYNTDKEQWNKLVSGMDKNYIYSLDKSKCDILKNGFDIVCPNVCYVGYDDIIGLYYVEIN